jgi:hypothetical protein
MLKLLQTCTPLRACGCCLGLAASGHRWRAPPDLVVTPKLQGQCACLHCQGVAATRHRALCTRLMSVITRVVCTGSTSSGGEPSRRGAHLALLSSGPPAAHTHLPRWARQHHALNKQQHDCLVSGRVSTNQVRALGIPDESTAIQTVFLSHTRHGFQRYRYTRGAGVNAAAGSCRRRNNAPQDVGHAARMGDMQPPRGCDQL